MNSVLQISWHKGFRNVEQRRKLRREFKRLKKLTSNDNKYINKKSASR